jgi:hypothetical protein
MVWLSLELEGISCSYSWFYDLFCAEQNVKVIIIGVSFLALVLYSLNTRPSLKAMLKYEGCERLLILMMLLTS